MILSTKKRKSLTSDPNLRRLPQDQSAGYSKKTRSVYLIIGYLIMFSLAVKAGGATVPAMPGPVTGQTNVCSYVGTSQSLAYSINPVAGAELYLWTVPPTVSIVSGQGTTRILVTFSAAFTSSANKQIRVRSISEDGNSADRLFYLVAQQPSTPSSIVGPSNACVFMGTTNAAVYTTARNPTASGYIWGAPAGTVITHPNRPGPNDTIVHVVFRSDFKTGQVTVQAANSCGFSAARAITVAGSAPSMPGIMTGPTNACAYMLPNGAIATYSINPLVGATSYTWLTPPDCLVDHPNGPGTEDVTITVRFPSTFTGGTISVIANSGCDESAPRTLNISKLNPSAPGLITPVQTVICPTREYSYSLPAMPSNTTAINWSVPPDAIGFSGQGTTNITVLYPEQRLAGNVTATATSNCASSVSRILPVSLGRCQNERAANTAGRGVNAEAATGPGKTLKTTVGQADKEEGTMTVNIASNPTTSNFKLQVNAPGKKLIHIRLRDLQGREVKNMTANPGQALIFGNELKSGTYILEVTQGKIKRTEKLLKL